ncbi:transcriptional regulator [Shewanella sp. WXL01]|uniref:helix-turn-helix domain-containing protein n=1 Tax=Shewanella sp. WXL01 TaxID=2709721 RepID=UPI0014385F7F|nr:helix-turn-helix domain-containing protein [Shewanella sp. WXL01]NKF51386.1 transcriptional regulator [Shewanella sp. WXL01]
MKAQEIKDKLRDLGITLSILEEATGIKRSHFSQVINHHNKSMKVATTVAKAIGVPVEQAFPNHFEVANKRKAAKVLRQQAVAEVRERLAS